MSINRKGTREIILIKKNIITRSEQQRFINMHCPCLKSDDDYIHFTEIREITRRF